MAVVSLLMPVCIILRMCIYCTSEIYWGKKKNRHAILEYSIIFSEIYLDTKVSVILCPILSQRLVQ